MTEAFTSGADGIEDGAAFAIADEIGMDARPPETRIIRGYDCESLLQKLLEALDLAIDAAA